MLFFFPRCATYADCLGTSYKSSCEAQEAGGFCVSNWFICRGVHFHRKRTATLKILASREGYSTRKFLDLVLFHHFVGCFGPKAKRKMHPRSHKRHKSEQDMKMFQCLSPPKKHQIISSSTIFFLFLFSVRHERRWWVKKVNLSGWLPLSSAAAVFVALLLLPVMETSRGPAWLGSCTSVFLSLCHPGHDEHKQGAARGVFQNREGQQRKKQQQQKKKLGKGRIQFTSTGHWLRLIARRVKPAQPMVLFDRKVLSLSSSQLQNKIHEVLLASLRRHFGCTGIFGAKLAESTRG